MVNNIPNVSAISVDIIGGNSKASAGFSSLLSQAVGKVDKKIKASSDLKERFTLGDPTVTLPEVMLTSQESKIALTTTIEVRNKFLEAYRDIINMPV